MAHMIDKSNGRANIAYAGATPWHGLGTAKPAGEQWSLAQWIDAAGIAWDVVRVPAFAHMPGGERIDTGAFFNVRSDTNALLGWQTHTDRRVDEHPRDIAAFVHDYVAMDERFQMEVMGAIKGGSQIWATAVFNGETTIAGDRHRSYLLARTSYDGSLAHTFQMTTVRAVCNNTLSLAYADSKARVSVRHTQKIDKQVVAKQLAGMAKSVDQYKAIGDAMAQHTMAAKEISDFFKTLLHIPLEAKQDELTTRTLNNFNDLRNAYVTTVRDEGAPANSAWSALQAVTRYADHDRTVRGDDNTSDAEKRFTSSQFGSGDVLKGQAMAMLMPRIKDRVLIPA
jgi:phage/plasmid-like protein (TIGR03299 family)